MGVCLIVSAVIPAEHSVGSSNNIAITKLLSIFCLRGSGFGAVITRSRNHSFITWNYFCVGIIHIYLHRVNNLSLGTVVVINYDFGFSNARG